MLVRLPAADVAAVGGRTTFVLLWGLWTLGGTTAELELKETTGLGAPEDAIGPADDGGLTEEGVLGRGTTGGELVCPGGGEALDAGTDGPDGPGTDALVAGDDGPGPGSPPELSDVGCGGGMSPELWGVGSGGTSPELWGVGSGGNPLSLLVGCGWPPSDVGPAVSDGTELASAGLVDWSGSEPVLDASGAGGTWLLLRGPEGSGGVVPPLAEGGGRTEELSWVGLLLASPEG